MVFGIDFDNTIVSYHGLFYATARCLNWMPEQQDQSKNAVKNFFVSRNLEPKWTELQGKVYGEAIKDATPYDGVKDMISILCSRGIKVHIISHKTQYPVIGDKLDFHKAAEAWLEKNGIFELGIPQSNVHFNSTKELKIRMIRDLNCQVFIDDLPSILHHEEFPPKTKKILFDPYAANTENREFLSMTHWSELEGLLLDARKYRH